MIFTLQFGVLFYQIYETLHDDEKFKALSLEDYYSHLDWKIEEWFDEDADLNLTPF